MNGHQFATFPIGSKLHNESGKILNYIWLKDWKMVQIYTYQWHIFNLDLKFEFSLCAYSFIEKFILKSRIGTKLGYIYGKLSLKRPMIVPLISLDTPIYKILNFGNTIKCCHSILIHKIRVHRHLLFWNRNRYHMWISN